MAIDRQSAFTGTKDVAAPLQQRGAARLIVAEEPDEASLLAAIALCE